MSKTVVSIALSLLALSGCASGPLDLSAAGRVHVADVDSAALDVGPPRVQADRHDVIVSGTVTRKPGFDGPVPGRLLVTVLAADQKTVLEEFTTGWNPPHIPPDGDRRATYAVRYGYLPPDGSTVRVAHEADPGAPDNSAGTNAVFRPGYRVTDRQTRQSSGATNRVNAYQSGELSRQR